MRLGIPGRWPRSTPTASTGIRSPGWSGAAAPPGSPCVSSCDVSGADHGDDRTSNWRDDAACRDADPELFFPVGTAGPALRQIRDARRICCGCPAKPRAWPGRWTTGSPTGSGRNHRGPAARHPRPRPGHAERSGRRRCPAGEASGHPRRPSTRGQQLMTSHAEPLAAGWHEARSEAAYGTCSPATSRPRTVTGSWWPRSHRGSSPTSPPRPGSPGPSPSSNDCSPRTSPPAATYTHRVTLAALLAPWFARRRPWPTWPRRSPEPPCPGARRPGNTAAYVRPGSPTGSGCCGIKVRVKVWRGRQRASYA